MHRYMLVVTALLASGLVIGCRPKVVPVPPPRVEPASPQQVESIRALYRQHYPGSEIGVVMNAVRESQLVAVGEIDVHKMAKDQVVTFIDANQNVLATGRVFRILDDSIHVRYDPPSGPHEPTVGDIMVRF